MPMKKCDYNGQYERLEIAILEHRKWKKWWLKKKNESHIFTQNTKAIINSNMHKLWGGVEP